MNVNYCKCGCGEIVQKKYKKGVVEYDEPRHYDNEGNLKQKDIIRQNEIIQKLNCYFFRYNEKKKELYEVENNH